MSNDDASKTPLVLFVFCLLLCLSAIYWQWLCGQRAFYIADLTYYFEPFTRFVAQQLTHRCLNLWNPYLYCGMSQLAVPSPEIFYPPALVFVLLPFSQALACFLIFHQLIAGVGGYLLVRHWGWLPACVVGVTCAASGYMFGLNSNYTLVATAAWLPLLLAVLKGVQPCFTRSNVSQCALVAVITYALITAGRPEVFAPALVVALAYTVSFAVCVWCSKRVQTGVKRRLFLQLFSLACGATLAGPMLCPTLEWFSVSPRAHGLDLSVAYFWSANWYDLLCLVLIQPLGDLSLLGSRFLSLVATRAGCIPFLQSAYVGPAIVTLAFWGAGDRGWRMRWAVLAGVVVSVVMATGHYTPVSPALYHLFPVLSCFRYPVKFIIVLILCLAILAGRGVYLAQRKRVSTRMQVAGALLWTGGLIAGMVLLGVPEVRELCLYFPWLKNTHVDLTIMGAAQHCFAQSAIVAGLLGLCFSLLVWVFHQGKLNARVFAGACLAFVFCPLLFAALGHMRPGTHAGFYQYPSPLAAQLVKLTGAVHGNGNGNGIGNGCPAFTCRVQPLYRDPLLVSGKSNEPELPYQEGYYQHARQVLLPNTNVDFHIPYTCGYEAAETRYFKELYSSVLSASSQRRGNVGAGRLSDLPLARFCKITSTGYVLTQAVRQTVPPLAVPVLDSRYFKLVSEDKTLNVRIYRCLDYLPRAYLAGSIRYLSTRQDLTARILCINGSEKDRFNDTWIEDSKHNTSPVLQGVPAVCGKPVRFISETANRVELQVEAPGNNLLVLTDSYYPGWEAQVDGKKANILRANGFCRALALSPGVHNVSFQYHPQSLYLGLSLSGVTMLGLLVLFVCAP